MYQRGTEGRVREDYVRQLFSERQKKLAEDLRIAYSYILPAGERYTPVAVEVAWRPLPLGSAVMSPDGPMQAAEVAPQRAAALGVAIMPLGSEEALLAPAQTSRTVPTVAIPLDEMDIGFQMDPNWDAPEEVQRTWWHAYQSRFEFPMLPRLIVA